MRVYKAVSRQVQCRRTMRNCLERIFGYFPARAVCTRNTAEQIVRTGQLRNLSIFQSRAGLREFVSDRRNKNHARALNPRSRKKRRTIIINIVVHYYVYLRLQILIILSFPSAHVAFLYNIIAMRLT